MKKIVKWTFFALLDLALYLQIGIFPLGVLHNSYEATTLSFFIWIYLRSFMSIREI